jgi:hypothetical protein
MSFLSRRPLITTLVFSIAMIASVYAVQSWMTEPDGEVDRKDSVFNPPG